MKILLAIIISFFLVVLQASLYPYLNISGAFPNLILILVLILSFLQGYKKSLAWIFCGGFFLDIFSFANPIGISILSLFVVGYLVHFFSQNIFKKTSIYSIILIGVTGTLIYRIFLILILAIASINFQITFTQLLSQIVYNTVILLPLFYLIRHFLLKQKRSIL